MLDLTGEKYGKLLVLEEAERDKNNKRQWLCQCECGNKKIIRMNDLRNGKIISCGCARTAKLIEANKARKDQVNINNGIDLTGQKFGRLTVLELDEEETLKHRTEKNKKLYWKCQCDCGNIKTIIGSALRNGDTQSCGCFQKEQASKNMKIKIQPKGALARRKDLSNQIFGLLTAIDINEKVTKEKNQGKVYWNCLCQCGNTRIAPEDKLVNGEIQSCGCLKKSNGESYIIKILNENNISFLREVTFNDLKDKNSLRFDFAILDSENKIIKLIEFDGRQHYDLTSCWHTESVILHDKMKNQYCKDHNIKLLRITKLEDITLENILNNETIL